MIYRLISSIAIGSAVCIAGAQYQAIILDPPGSSLSVGLGISGNTQVGEAVIGGMSSAVVWGGTAGSFVSLNLAGDVGSTTYCTNGTQHGGAAILPSGEGHAAVWTGTSPNYVDVHPAGYAFSIVKGISGTQLSGFGSNPGVAQIALYWPSIAATAVNLTPAGATTSNAEAIAPLIQAGYARFGGSDHAGIWSGSAGSFVDLHPAGATSSGIFGTDGNQHVGMAVVGGGSRGMLWTGASNTPVDLTPVGALTALLRGVSNGKQCGLALFSGISSFPTASVWSGTAASYVDLHQFLPTGMYVYSDAYGINAAGEIIGTAQHPFTGLVSSVLWKPIPPYTFVGFEQPINDPATPESSFRCGAVIRVRFQLLDPNGDPVTTETAHISVTHLGAVETPVNESDFSMPADDGTQFNVQGSSYSYMLATRNLQSGSRYRITATYGTGSHSVTVAIQ